MDAYTVKANNDSTDENPSDISLPTNTVLGRLSGDIVGLTSTNIKTILGLTSSYYFKQVSITDNFTTTISSSNGSETIKFVAGPNVTLTKDTNNNIIIGAGAALSDGIKRIQTTTESSSKIASKLIFDTIKKFNLSGTSTLESNISIYPLFNSLGEYTVKFDLTPSSVANAVKISTNIPNMGVYEYTNVVLTDNTVLGRKTGSSPIAALSATDLRSIIGINSINTISLSNQISDTLTIVTPIIKNGQNQTLKIIGQNGIRVGNSNGNITIDYVNDIFNVLKTSLSKNLSGQNNIIDTNNITLQKQTNIYDLYISDVSNSSYSMSVQVKVVRFSTDDIRVITGVPQYSVLANNLIRSLTFSSSFVSGGYNLLLNTISTNKQYAVKFTHLSF